ncbi:hypothetical protein CLAFUW4_04259 [Fulvia fulva]|nr:hypothetical protein CLAFUR4_04245 [Fulvia fulva]WPV13683.1 hypothetical protein CLAFUW4_04259 [Fulvia fulva]
MAPTTAEQRFKEHEKAIRSVPGGARNQKRANERTVQAQWRARTQGQRDTIAALCAAALNAEAEFQRLGPDTAAADADAATLIARVDGLRAIGHELRKRIGGPESNWLRTLGRAAELLEDFEDVQVAAGNAWQALSLEHGRQQASDITSVNDARAKRDLARNGIAGTRARINQLHGDMDQPRVPANLATGVQKICPGWLPPERLTNWRSNAFAGAQAINAAATPPVGGLLGPGTWRYKRAVGAGGQGSAGLWLLFDANDMLVHRVVRKTIDYMRHWYDVRNWAGDPKDINTRLPLELAAHSEMRRTRFALNNNMARITNQHVVALGAAPDQTMVDEAREMYQLYTEWCPHGDLISIIDHYKGTVPRQIVPEPFIWAVAESLIYVGTAMQTGAETGNPLQRWNPIVHRDLKPGNIFLANEDPTGTWPLYPRPLVGDWGLAVQPTTPASSNPNFYRGAGTPGCRAPEQIEYVDNNNLTPLNGWPLNEKTNVFGMGIILYCLVTQRSTSKKQAWWLGDGTGDRTYQLELPGGVPNPAQNFANRYSPELRRLIDRCTAYDQAARPDFATLRAMFTAVITQNNGGEDPNITKGMRASTANLATIMNEGVHKPADVYTLRLHRNAIDNFP